MPKAPNETEEQLLKDLFNEDDADDRAALDDGIDDDQDDDDSGANEDHQLNGDDSDDNGDREDEGDGLEDIPARRASREPAPQREDNRQQPTRLVDPFDPRVRLKQNTEGSLIAPDGKVIARAGRERTNFERWRAIAQKDRADGIKLAQRVVEIAEGSKELYNQFVMLQQQKSMFAEAGMTAQEQAQMLGIAIAYKKEPLKAIKMMLTNAQLAGVDIKSLGVAGGLDPAMIVNTIKEHIDERLKPVSDASSRTAENQAVMREGQGFFDRNPDARTFAETLPGGPKQLAKILAQAKARAPDLRLDDLWKQLHYEILRNPDVSRALTRVVGKEQQRNLRKQNTRRSRTPSIRGDESFNDIGKSVLADIQNALNRQ